MALEKRTVEMTLGISGRQDFLDRGLIDQDKLADSNNVQIVKGGALEKRGGYQYSGESSIGGYPEGYLVTTNQINLNNRRVFFSQMTAAEYDPDDDIYTVSPGHVGSIITAATAPIYSRMSQGLYGVDIAICPVAPSNSDRLFTLVSEKTSTYVYHRVRESSIDGLSQGDENNYQSWLVATGGHQKAKLVVAGERLGLVFDDGGTIKYSLMGADSESWGTAITLFSDINTNGYTGWDVCYYGDYWWIVYFRASDVKITRYNNAGSSQGSYYLSTHPIPSSALLQVCPTITICHDEVSTTPSLSKLCIMYGPSLVSGALRAATYVVKADLTSTYGSAAVPVSGNNEASTIQHHGATATYEPQGGRFAVYYTVLQTDGSKYSNNVLAIIKPSDGSLESVQDLNPGASLHKARDRYVITTPQADAGDAGPLMVQSISGYSYYSKIQSVGVFCEPDFVNIRPNHLTLNIYNNPISVLKYGNTYITANIVRTGLNYVSEAGEDVWRLGVDIISWLEDDLITKTRPRRAKNKILYPGGAPFAFSGGAIAQIGGIPSKPVISRITTASYGGVLDTGTYLYKIAYSLMVTGRPVRSRISAPYTVIAAADDYANTLIIALANYRISGSQWSDYVAEIYRTVANGSVFYRLPYDTEDYAWDGTVDDTELLLEPVLYTEGGILENYACPAATDLELHQERLWAIHMMSGDVYYSKQTLPDEDYSFNPALVVTNPRTELPVAIESLSFYHLIVFYKNAINFILGEGPNDQGSGSTYSMQELSNIHGCWNIKSIIRTQAGIYFASYEGIYLIPVGLSAPQLISDDIRDAYPSLRDLIIGVDVKIATHEILWTCTNGKVIVYNEHYGAWLTWDILVDARPSQGVIRCTDSSNDVHAVYLQTTNGYLNRFEQSSTIKYDYSNDYYDVSITTPWIKLAGMQGYQRTWKAFLLLEKDNDTGQFDLVVTVWNDYRTDAGLTQVIIIPDWQIYNYKPLIIEIGIANQRATAVSFKFEIKTEPYSSSFGIKIKSLRLEYGVLPGSAKTPRLNS